VGLVGVASRQSRFRLVLRCLVGQAGKDGMRWDGSPEWGGGGDNNVLRATKFAQKADIVTPTLS